MSKNKVQFQKELSLTDFMAEYGDEQQCRSFIFQARWPQGFCCPECGYDKFCEIKSRKCF